MAAVSLVRIDRSIHIAAPPDRVWRALTDAAELLVWFKVGIEGTIAPGAEVWMTSVLPGHVGQRFRVRIVEMSPPHRLVWHWHPGEIQPDIDYDREPMTTVTFVLESAGDGTRVTVSETGFDAIAVARRAKVFGDNDSGWTEVLPWLRSHVETRR